MSTIFHDLRHAFRMFTRNSGASIVVVLTLALGIGATTTIFSFVDAVVLQPLLYQDSQRLVLVQTELRGGRPFAVSPADFLEWQDRNHVFDRMTAFMSATYSLTTGGEPERVVGAAVSSRLFETLGVKPLIGTARTPERTATRRRSRSARHVAPADSRIDGGSGWSTLAVTLRAASGEPSSIRIDRRCCKI